MLSLKNQKSNEFTSKLFVFEDNAFDTSDEELNSENEEKSDSNEDSDENKEADMNDFHFDDTSELITTQMLVERKINELKSQSITNNQNKTTLKEKIEHQQGSKEVKKHSEDEANEKSDEEYNSDEAQPMEGDSDEDEQEVVDDNKIAEKELDTEKYHDIVREKEIQRKKEFFEFPEEPSPDDNPLSFSQMNLSRPILKALSNMGITSPTPIQSRAIPHGLLGKDIVGSAITGSGKTMAFMLPIIERLIFRPKAVPVTRVLVLVPTRELAIQCQSVSKNICQFTDIQLGLAIGGLNLKQQEVELKRRPDILIATPGRLIDFIKNAPSFTLDAIEILVLDEADRMLEDGFEEELNEIIMNTPKSRQTMLFSATMTDNVDQLVKLSLNRPVRLFVDPVASTSLRLTQEFIRIRPHRENDKLAILLALCKRTIKSNSILFFRSKKGAHDAYILFGLLGLKAVELHGNLSQPERMSSLELFKERKVEYLLATDLVARGLDIPFVKCVINVDMPSTIELYLHRVGRTARAGRPGRSISLVTESDRKLLREVHSKPTCSLKQRVIKKEVLQKYVQKLEEAQKQLVFVLEAEKQDKEIKALEQQVTKAENMIKHKEEIFSRPKRIWFKDDVHSKKSKSSLKRKREIDEDPKLLQENRRAVKQAKRSHRSGQSTIAVNSLKSKNKKQSKFKKDSLKVATKKRKQEKVRPKKKKATKSERKAHIKQRKVKSKAKRK